MTGAPAFDPSGRLTQIRDAVIAAFENVLDGVRIPDVVSLDDILASAPGLEPGGIDLTDAEAEAFYEAMGF